MKRMFDFSIVAIIVSIFLKMKSLRSQQLQILFPLNEEKVFVKFLFEKRDCIKLIFLQPLHISMLIFYTSVEVLRISFCTASLIKMQLFYHGLLFLLIRKTNRYETVHNTFLFVNGSCDDVWLPGYWRHI